MQTATYTTRLFQPSDIERVVYINRRCLPENYTSLFFMDLYKRFPSTFIVAQEENEVVGYIMCRIETGISTFNILKVVKKGHIVSIAVLPENQRRGIASELVRKATFNMSKDFRSKECYLEVRTSNSPAIELYKKHRFEIRRLVRGYYADGEDAYVMSKKLVERR